MSHSHIRFQNRFRDFLTRNCRSHTFFDFRSYACRSKVKKMYENESKNGTDLSQMYTAADLFKMWITYYWKIVFLENISNVTLKKLIIVETRHLIFKFQRQRQCTVLSTTYMRHLDNGHQCSRYIILCPKSLLLLRHDHEAHRQQHAAVQDDAEA